MFEFFVDHPPVPQPRPRVSMVRGFARAYIPKTHAIHAYKEAIVAEYLRKRGKPFAGPIRCDIVAVMPRPKAKVWKRKPMTSEFHAGRPDVDNLAKGVLDALNGHAWADDAQVAVLTCRKRLAAGNEPAGVHITISELHGSPSP